MTTLALAIVAASIPVALLVGLASRRVSIAIPTMLDLWIAAGLLRLSQTSSWSALAGAATLIAIRKLVAAAAMHGPLEPAHQTPAGSVARTRQSRESLPRT